MAEETEQPLAKSVKDDGRRNKIIIGLTIVGLIIAYLSYRRMQANSANAAPTAAPDLTSTGQNAGTGQQDLSGFSNALAGLAQQEQSDVATLAGNQTQTQGFLSTLANSQNQLSQQIANLGTPANPAAPTSGPPNLPAQVIAAMKANGESVVDVVNEGAGALYLTNKGGVYSVGSGPNNTGAPQFFGSYLGYASKQANPGAEIAGHGNFTGGKLTLLQNGGYTETNSQGENYTFGPGLPTYQ